MSSGLGSAVIESGASVLEKIIADIEAEELLRIDAELIEANWDPYRVEARNLLFLAFAMGVQLWDDDWPEEIKRAWLASQWQFKALRGTETAIRMALGLWGYTLEQVITPPQGFYASRDFTVEERNAWIQQMPQLRIRRELQHGYGWADEWFAGDSFAGEAFAGIDDAPILSARRGFLRRDGVDTPLQSEILTTTVNDGVTEDIEQIAIPGRSSLGFIAGEDFAGDERYIGAAEIEAELVTVRKNQSYLSKTYELGLTTVSASLKPLDVRFFQESAVGNGGEFFYAGDFAGDGFTAYDNAADMIYDVMYLFDATVAGIMTAGASFAGVDRVGIEQKTAELLVDLKTKAGPFEWVAGESFTLEGCATPDDDKARDNAMRAILAAKAERDTVLVSFAPKRPLQFRDPIGEDTKVGAWVEDLL